MTRFSQDVYDPDQRMIDAQARIISKLRADYADIQTQFMKLEMQVERDAQYAEFYRQMQDAIKSNPILQGEWQRFCSFLKMADPEHGKKSRKRK